MHTVPSGTLGILYLFMHIHVCRRRYLVPGTRVDEDEGEGGEEEEKDDQPISVATDADLEPGAIARPYTGPLETGGLTP